MIKLKTQNPRIATDGKQIFALFKDEKACDHCGARYRETHCGFIKGFDSSNPPKCGTWKVIG